MMLRGVGSMSGRRGAKKASSLYPGVTSTEYSSKPTFKKETEKFPILRQSDLTGKLLKGIKVPFDWETATKIYSCMIRSTVYDSLLHEMQRQGRISFYCTNHGEEAASTATAAALEPQDMIWPQYRELGMFLWRGLTTSKIVDACMGNEGDTAKGRALPVHYMLPDANVQVVHAVLGTHISQAPGAGYGYRLSGEDRVAVAYFGDGAASEGDALSALNYASIFKSQTIFIVRNNGYSISTPVSDQYAGDGIGSRGPAFNISTIRVDGNDVIAVYNATKAARKLCIENKEPVLIELMTYRVGDHTTSDNSALYRPEGELSARSKDTPIDRFKSLLIKNKQWSEEQDTELRKVAHSEITKAMKEGEAKQRANPTEMFTDMYSEMPWHLKEQHDTMHEHIKNNKDKYNVSLYNGL
eukprot:TRINITY_DN8794_c4_g1_i1.p1 TRINITY_DN8794_c4_g1~~TRINITY_DN8794_c4_g1_i1.p1  ORF type:complete len:412 (+),score=88.14 TRINITY_DN8794_c4_g1_i1:50-1285(+)